jgi:pyruvate kinase
VVLSPSAQTCRRLALGWGVSSLQVGEVGHSDSMIALAIERLLEEKLLNRGDRFVAVFGAPTDLAPETNSISVRVAG